MNRVPRGMPSELLDSREVERRFKEVDRASQRARSRIAVHLANSTQSVGLVKLVSRSADRTEAE
jgi:hypothetical protein